MAKEEGKTNGACTPLRPPRRSLRMQKLCTRFFSSSQRKHYLCAWMRVRSLACFIRRCYRASFSLSTLGRKEIYPFLTTAPRLILVAFLSAAVHAKTGGINISNFIFRFVIFVSLLLRERWLRKCKSLYGNESERFNNNCAIIKAHLVDDAGERMRVSKRLD